MPVAERGQRCERRQKVSRDGKRDDDGERSRIGALRVLDILGHAGNLLVSGVEPNGESETDSKYLGRRQVGRHQRHKRIVVPLGEAEDDHGNHGNEHKQFENRGGLADHLNAPNVDPANDGDQSERNEPMFPAGDSGKVESQIVGEEHGVGTAEKE